MISALVGGENTALDTRQSGLEARYPVYPGLELPVAELIRRRRGELLREVLLIGGKNVNDKRVRLEKRVMARRDLFNTDKDQRRVERNGTERRDSDAVLPARRITGGHNADTAGKAGKCIAKFVLGDRHGNSIYLIESLFAKNRELINH